MLASLQSTRTVTSERPTEQCNPGRLLSRVIGFDTGLKRCRFEDTAVGQLPPSPRRALRRHLLGRDDLVRNAYLIEQPRCGNPVVRARPTSSRQSRNDARYTVVTDGMVRSPEQWCDLRR